MMVVDRLLLILGALTGFAGVGLSALAQHGHGDDNLRIGAQFLLFHAPALLALASISRLTIVSTGLVRFSGFLLILGLTLFSGGLAYHSLIGAAPFPLAAPLGGICLMAGWLAASLSPFFGRRDH